MPSEIAEEYLECIFELTEGGNPAKTTDIAEALELKPASVTEMVQKLAAERYLIYEKYKGASLTDKGMKVARKIKRRHRLLERFLVDIVGVRRSESHEEACRLEHVISEESERVICQMTNNPRFCPDGDPIPECDHGECASCPCGCSVPLTDLKAKDVATITHLECDDPSRIRRLISMGFVPGREVEMEEHVPLGGPILVRLDESRVALAKEYAELVKVQRERVRARGSGAKQSG